MTAAHPKPGAIPPFEARNGYPNAVLPDGVYPCDEDSVRERFVDGFSGSTRRSTVFNGFVRLRTAATGLNLAFTQWVDGSFVEAKHEPGDIDVVTFADGDALNAMSVDVQDKVEQLLNAGEATQQNYSSHTFLVPAYPQGHPDWASFDSLRRYWRQWWGTTRDHDPTTGQPWIAHQKGFLEMIIGNRDAAPQISPARSAP